MSEVTMFAVTVIFSEAVFEALETTEIEFWEPGGDVMDGEEITLYVQTQEEQELLLMEIQDAQREDDDEIVEEIPPEGQEG